MPITKEDKILIKELRIHKGYNAYQLMQEFPDKGWSKSTLNWLFVQIDSTGSVEEKPKTGRPRSTRDPENIATVEELVFSQEDNPGTHKSIRTIARVTGIHRSSIHRIVHKDLELKCFKRKKVQELTEDNKLKRLARAKQLLNKYPSSLVPFIFFTDEKLFTVAAPVNSQNDRLYAVKDLKKKELPASRLLHPRSTFSKSVMVSVGVSMMGCTELIFVEPGIKINGQYYRDVLLSQHLLPAIKNIAGEFFVFQQDSAPAHRARETIELLSQNTPAFISPFLWPPNSPDLNPVDYRIWGLLQERVYATPIRNVEHLKQRLIEEWCRFDQHIVDHAVNQWRVRLRACVRNAGSHFEHQLK